MISKSLGTPLVTLKEDLGTTALDVYAEPVHWVYDAVSTGDDYMMRSIVSLPFGNRYSDKARSFAVSLGSER